MSKFDQVDEVLLRCRQLSGTKDGRMMVKNTTVIMKSEPMDSSMEVNTVDKLNGLAELCSSALRTVDPTDKVEYIKLNYSQKDMHNEMMLGIEDDFKAVVEQEHPLRDLRKRSMLEQRDLKGYRHAQQPKHYFYPQLDDLVMEALEAKETIASLEAAAEHEEE